MRLTTAAALILAFVCLSGCDKPKAPTVGSTSTDSPSASVDKSTSPVAKQTTTPPSVETAKPKVEFTITTDELAKEVKANKRGAASKYKGKVVELTGPVAFSNLFGNIGFSLRPSDLGLDTYVSVDLRKADRSSFETMKVVSRGQSMVVRGRLSVDGDYFQMLDAELVKAGPTTAVAATVAAVKADMDKPFKEKKYTEVLHDIVMRVEVVGHEKKMDLQQYMTICDPGKPESKMVGQLQVSDPAQMKAWSEIKPGTVVIVMAEGGFEFDAGKKTPLLRNARVLSAPPEGVALPEVGK